jgi:DNA-binding NarL/FixJ family response regulator
VTLVPVAVADQVPAYRRGLVRALAEAGFEAEETEEIDAWIAQAGRRGLVFTVTGHEDSAVVTKCRVAAPDLVVVALLREPTTDMYLELLQAGAAGVAPWDAALETLVKVVQCAVENHCMLPVSVAQAMAARVSVVASEMSSIRPFEAEWLQIMANGATVAQLAQAVGYSERAMFRMLHDLYARMGVRNRTEALMKAAQWRSFS